MTTVFRLGLLKAYKFNFKRYLPYFSKEEVTQFSMADLSMMELANLRELKTLTIFGKTITIYSTIVSLEKTKNLSTAYYTGPILLVVIP